MVLDKNYSDAVQAIKATILESQYRAAKSTNGVQLSLYYAIGRYVSTNTRTGAWGTGAIETISDRLQRELPGLKGFSVTNIKSMRIFYEAWDQTISSDPNSAATTAGLEVEGLSSSLASDSSNAFDELTPVDVTSIRRSRVAEMPDSMKDDFLSIGFSQHRLIVQKVKLLEERLFYIHECAENHFSYRELKRAIARDDFHHLGRMPSNFLDTMGDDERALRAINTFKDEYLLDFINVEELGARDALDVDERVVEQGIVHDVRNFIMEFGRDFTFVGNQYHLDAFGEDQYIDLLFFNRELNCLVAVELKSGPFKTSYLGQLSGYLSVLDGFVRKPHEENSIGIVLCKDMNRAFVDYVVRDYDKPMGVATYKTSKDMPEELLRALPPIEDLESLLAGGEC